MASALEDSVLRSIFPPAVAEKLLKNERVEPEQFSDVTVLFADICGFTPLSAICTPLEVHDLLNSLYMVIDFCLKYYPRLYKVETIGDAIMIVSGAPLIKEDSVNDLVQFSMLIHHVVKHAVLHPKTKQPISLRIGMHTGDVVGGVMGFLMPRYTFSGDTVNTAARTQTMCEEGQVLISDKTAAKVVASAAGEALDPSVLEGLTTAAAGESRVFRLFSLVSMGVRDVKGKGGCLTFEVQASEVWRELMAKGHSRVLAGMQEFRVAYELDCVAATRQVQSKAKLTASPSMISLFGGNLEAPWQAPRQAADGGSSSSGTSSISSSSSSGSSSSGSSSSSSKTSYKTENLSMRPHCMGVVENSILRKRHSSGPATDIVMSSRDLDRMTILVVEDSPVQRKLVCRQLSSINPTWSVCSSGSVADFPELLQRNGIQRLDLLLLDMNLGLTVSDGFDSLRQLKSAHANLLQFTMVVMMSRDCHEREVQACYMMADGFWPKPLAPSGVLQAHLIYLATLKAHQLQNSIREMPPDLEQTPYLSDVLSPDLGIARVASVRAMRQLTGADETIVSLRAFDGLKVIVVEDSPVQSKLICRQLRGVSPTWHVRSAATPEEVFALFRKNDAKLKKLETSEYKHTSAQLHFLDLLLLDMHLGKSSTDGFELLRSLKAEFPEQIDGSMVVMTSKDSLERELLSCFLAADGFWGKPLAPSGVLVAHLAHMSTLKAHRQRQRLRDSTGGDDNAKIIAEQIPQRLSALVSGSPFFGGNVALDLCCADLGRAAIVQLKPVQGLEASADPADEGLFF